MAVRGRDSSGLGKALRSAAAPPFPPVLQLGPHSRRALPSERNKELKFRKQRFWEMQTMRGEYKLTKGEK